MMKPRKDFGRKVVKNMFSERRMTDVGHNWHLERKISVKGHYWRHRKHAGNINDVNKLLRIRGIDRQGG